MYRKIHGGRKKKKYPAIEPECIALSEDLALLPGLVGGDLLKTYLTIVV